MLGTHASGSTWLFNVVCNGRWRATAKLAMREPCEIGADDYLPWHDRQLAVASRSDGASGVVLNFVHTDHFQPIEARLFGVEGSRGSLAFSGWRLDWLEPLA